MSDNNPVTPPDDDEEQRPETDYTFIPFGALERRLDDLGPYDTDPIDAGPWS